MMVGTARGCWEPVLLALMGPVVGPVAEGFFFFERGNGVAPSSAGAGGRVLRTGRVECAGGGSIADVRFAPGTPLRANCGGEVWVGGGGWPSA